MTLIKLFLLCECFMFFCTFEGLQWRRYLFLQDAGDLPQRSVQARHPVVGPLPAVLALQLLQQVLHHSLQPEHARAHMETCVYKPTLIRPDCRLNPVLYGTPHSSRNY